ncbi:MAG: hypothetical protein U1E40_08360 [Amaricoccus sp.]
MNFEDLFKTALDAGIGVVKTGAKEAEDWVVRTANANKDFYLSIATAVARHEISQGTATRLLNENDLRIDADAAALSVIIRATAQGAINTFMNSLRAGLSAALKLAL